MERTKHHIAVGFEFLSRAGKPTRVCRPAHVRDADGAVVKEQWVLEHFNYGRWLEGRAPMTTIAIEEYVKQAAINRQGRAV